MKTSLFLRRKNDENTKNFKRYLSILLTGMLILTLLPAPSFAEGEEIHEITVTGVTDPVAGEMLTTEGIR